MVFKKYSFSARKNNVLLSMPQETGKALWFSQFQACPSPQPSICRAFVTNCQFRRWGNGKKTCTGGGELVKTKSGERRFFFNILLKNTPNCIALEIFIKLIFNNLVLKRNEWFLLHHSPIHPSMHRPKKLLATIVIGSHKEEKQSMYGFKGLKKKTLFYVNCCGRKA